MFSMGCKTFYCYLLVMILGRVYLRLYWLQRPYDPIPKFLLQRQQFSSDYPFEKEIRQD